MERDRLLEAPYTAPLLLRPEMLDMRLDFRSTFLVAALCAAGSAQSLPEMFYYRFNEGSGTTTANLASPGVGSPTATVTAHTLAPTPAGQFSDGALLGAGPAGFVDTGWPANFGTGAWTISFWLDTTGATSTSLTYLFGVPVSFGFRCFTSSSGTLFLSGNVTQAGTAMTNVTLPGGSTAGTPHVCTFTYDPVTPTIRGYVNGVLVSTVAQQPLNIVSTANFYVAGQIANNGMTAGMRMDEFRVYSRTLSATEVAATWNVPLVSSGAQLNSIGTGCGGTGGIAPVLASAQLPFLGNSSFSLDVTQALPGAPAFLFLSVGIATVPWPLPSGCLVYLEPTSLIQLLNSGLLPIGPLIANGSGAASFPLPIPFDPNLANVVIGAQVAVSDPAAPGGLAVTNAVVAQLN
jgi:hypothetical protein